MRKRAGAIEGDDPALVASGQMTLPVRPFNEKKFWAIGGRVRKSKKLREAIRRAMEEERG